MRYLIIILTLASLLALTACRGSGELEVIPVGGPVTTDSSRETGGNTVKDRTEPTGSTAANAMSRKALGPEAWKHPMMWSSTALTGWTA